MPVTNTDAVLWYKVGVFGDAGYAVPNFSNDFGSLNPQILNLTTLVGRNLFHLMHHEDVDLRIPPSINTCLRIHKLYVRVTHLLDANSIRSGELNLEALHSRPAGEVFRVFPVPYFKARNPFLRRYSGLALVALAEMMQHTENRKEMEISQGFASSIHKYFKRIYTNMAMELFGVDREMALADGFVLGDEDLSGYDPSKFFTSTEMADTVPRLDRVFTEDRLELLAEGIPVTDLPDLTPWPTNLTNFYETFRTDATVEQGGSAAPGEANTTGANSGSSSLPTIPTDAP